jgi:hypothetical protein
MTEEVGYVDALNEYGGIRINSSDSKQIKDLILVALHNIKILYRY